MILQVSEELLPNNHVYKSSEGLSQPSFIPIPISSLQPLTMPLSRILLTGATGSVGAHVLDQLLANGAHIVTAIVRSLSRSHPFLSTKYAAAIASKHLTLLEVPDLTTPHVFDLPASAADAIIHIATPLAYTGDLEAQVIDPTWAIDESILIAAKDSPSVKRVVITGSIVSTMNPFTDLASERTITAADYNGIKLEESLGHPGAAYMYAKTAAEQKSWAFMKREKPHFDLVVLLAPSITGRCIQGGFVPSKTALGGMANIYNAVFDVKEVGFVFPYFM
jgi:nucleoside-diphosphate-sugar epimerase